MGTLIRFQSFDLLATLVAVVHADATVLFSNAALEDALGLPGGPLWVRYFLDAFTEPAALHNALEGARDNAFAALRYDAWLKRLGQEPMPVHVIVTHALTRSMRSLSKWSRKSSKAAKTAKSAWPSRRRPTKS